MTTNYPIIANCNYESAEDTTIHQIRKAVDSGLTDDDNLIAALDRLEEVLTRDAESGSAAAVERCQSAEQAVLRAWTEAVQASVEKARIARYRD